MSVKTYSPGQVAAAYFIEPVTLRAWHSDRYGLGCFEFGPTGRRVYSFADAALVGFVASRVNPYRWGWAVKQAAALANVMRPHFHDVWERYGKRDDAYVVMDEVAPTVTAWLTPGAGQGWKTHLFPSLSDWAAALATVETNPKFPGIRPDFDSVVVDVSLAFKAAAVALSRHGVMERADESGAAE